MRISITLATGSVLAFSSPLLHADGAFYGDPPDDTHPWAIHDMNRPQPPRVEPGTFSSQEQPGKPPSDAVILFDGTPASLAKWEADKNPPEPTQWIVKDGAMQCMPGSGYIRTREQWGDCQLHVEWAAPSKAEGSSQGRGNSGVFLMGETEVQVLDNFNNATYADGFAASVYGVNPPAANALRAPGEWQVYDIVFRRPVFKDGREVDTGYLTVFANGVLVQDHTPLEGGGGHRARSKPHPFPEKGPLKLQDHGNPVRYRNIWYRPLPPRAIEGGTDGRLTAEAATAKKKATAKSIVADAAKLTGNARMLRLLESLCYDQNPDILKQAEAMVGEFVSGIQKTPADKLEGKKGEVLHVAGALGYLIKFKFIPAGFPAAAELQTTIKSRGWDKK